MHINPAIKVIPETVPMVKVKPDGLECQGSINSMVVAITICMIPTKKKKVLRFGKYVDSSSLSAIIMIANIKALAIDSRIQSITYHSAGYKVHPLLFNLFGNFRSLH